MSLVDCKDDIKSKDQRSAVYTSSSEFTGGGRAFSRFSLLLKNMKPLCRSMKCGRVQKRLVWNGPFSGRFHCKIKIFHLKNSVLHLKQCAPDGILGHWFLDVSVIHTLSAQLLLNLMILAIILSNMKCVVPISELWDMKFSMAIWSMICLVLFVRTFLNICWLRSNYDIMSFYDRQYPLIAICWEIWEL